MWLHKNMSFGRKDLKITNAGGAWTLRRFHTFSFYFQHITVSQLYPPPLRRRLQHFASHSPAPWLPPQPQCQGVDLAQLGGTEHIPVGTPHPCLTSWGLNTSTITTGKILVSTTSQLLFRDLLTVSHPFKNVHKASKSTQVQIQGPQNSYPSEKRSATVENCL